MSFNKVYYSDDVSELIKIQGNNIVIPDGVTAIGSRAFHHRTSIISITLPERLKIIKDHAFWECTSLETINIPEGVEVIDEFVFSDCHSLKEIIIPKSAKTIKRNAFMNCKSLKNLVIPASITEIGRYVFGNCNSLVNITVNEENEFYCDADGVLFNKDKTMLICFPAGKNLSHYIVPNGVVKIASNAFESCSLENIVLPDSLTTIDSWAFDKCKNLKIVIIPDNVTSIDNGIGTYSFRGCPNLTIICSEKSYARKYCGYFNINYESKEETETGVRKYDIVRDYSEGRAAVYRPKNWGFIDEKGNEVIPCKYSSVRDFIDGMAIVRSKNKNSNPNKWGCIDKNGNEVIPFKYNEFNDFSDGVALVVYVESAPFHRGEHYGFGAYETEGYYYNIHYRFIDKYGNETFAHDEYEENTSWTAGADTFTINMPDNETAKTQWGKMNKNKGEA